MPRVDPLEPVGRVHRLRVARPHEASHREIGERSAADVERTDAVWQRLRVEGGPTARGRDGAQPRRQVGRTRDDGVGSADRAVVTEGTATALNGLGEVRGKTGTAEFTNDGSRAHGWFVGYRGDLAFAVLVVDGGTSEPAVATAGRFLTAVPQ